MDKLLKFKVSKSLFVAMTFMIVLIFFAGSNMVKAQDIDILLKGGHVIFFFVFSQLVSVYVIIPFSVTRKKSPNVY